MLADRARELLRMAAGGTTSPEVFRAVAGDFMAHSQDADAHEIGAALEILGRAFALPFTDQGVLAATLAGALVERGADATPLVAPMVEFLRRVAPLAADFEARITQADDDERAVAGRLQAKMPDVAKAYRALDAFHLPLIAILAASPQARAQSRGILAKLKNLPAQSRSWIWAMLMVLDDEPLLVIEPDTGLGLVGAISGISSNFQLHALLMDVFPQPDPSSPRRISQRAADILRGNVPEQRDEEGVTGQWNLYAWTALQETGRLSQDYDKSSTSHWVWGEGIPADIPAFESYRVVVLGPPSYLRGMLVQREFAGLRADIQIERLLSPGEVEAWVNRFAQA